MRAVALRGVVVGGVVVGVVGVGVGVVGVESVVDVEGVVVVGVGCGVVVVAGVGVGVVGVGGLSPPGALMTPDEEVERLVDEVDAAEGLRLRELAERLRWAAVDAARVASWCVEAGVLDVDDEGHVTLGGRRT